ncbi:MAG: sigma 54-interacting transcriptional regulator [Acidobacteria bacterium]|nr:sigma 54-interacting transcriptional regulator [Acidobacteriota bacterium]
MTSRLHQGDAERGGRSSKNAQGSPVVHITDARRAAGAALPLENQLEETREMLDQGLPSSAEARLRHIISQSRRDAALCARARHLHSVALQALGRNRDALEAVEMYEAPDSGRGLDAETFANVRVQLGLSHNYTGDHPKAIAILQAELRAATEQGGTDARTGNVYTALARVYRSINEYSIARDHNNKALEHFRRAGDWRGMAECYFGLGMADAHEGQWEKTLENFEQAVQLIGERAAPFLLGKIYTNAAAAYWWLQRPQEGIRALEKAVAYNERTEHKDNAVNAYNNLGINLMMIGEWDRSQAALKRALELVMELDEHSGSAAVVFDSLGELRMLRGDLAEAREYLERAVKTAAESGKKWNLTQIMRTLMRCYILLGLTEEALDVGSRLLTLAESIGDHRGICDARTLLAETRLLRGETEESAQLIARVSEQAETTTSDLAILGELQRVQGLLALAREDAPLAVHHFGRCLSISDMLGDRYRTARAHHLLGRAYAAASQPERAREHLGLAVHTFAELGAKLDLALAEESVDELESRAPEEQHVEPPAPAQLLTLRLAEAVASRELLLRELAAVVHQETRDARILVAEAGEDGHTKVLVAHGYDASEAAGIAAALDRAAGEEGRERYAAGRDARLYTLKPSSAPPATLLVAPRAIAVLPGGTPFEPLLKVVELGMDVCALRARARTGGGAQAPDSLAGASLMPGFIHSSPAMTRLVEEVHKIRSSDVTVLITGESGTGKELVARAIHALSSRRGKVFIPFNCTAVPKELSEGYLFGYRRGAFTGAVSDSAGVIRSAVGGTLFLDEIGDLPLDVQPKLLRFLQEGEIQPLGEQRPQKVDVRIITATNTDLEGMVADGRFREDLYYRLNVIRLRVPPLRERRSEIPTIVSYYINHYSAKFGRRDVQVTPQTLDLLMVCDWPGNVRQLTNEIQRIVARAEDGTVITPDHLSPELRRTSAPAAGAHTLMAPGSGLAAAAATQAISQGLTLADAMAELERRMIAEALRKHNGNISRAARELGLTRRGLYLKLGRHDLSASA